MIEPTVPQPEPTPFRAVLRPHRSLGPTGFLLFMVILGGASFVAGMIFTIMGAWPVLGFFGLDVLLVYIAFRLNYRAGRLHETIELNRSKLTVIRIHPTGRQERFSLNPYWVRVRLAEGKDGRTDLRLHLRGKELALGRFLTDDERRDFAKVLAGALLEARGGVRI